jgi:hypothetical protein
LHTDKSLNFVLFFHFSAPVVFVDFERINYAPPNGQDEKLLQFYFVFLREKRASQTDVISRVLRICRVRGIKHEFSH